MAACYAPGLRLEFDFILTGWDGFMHKILLMGRKDEFIDLYYTIQNTYIMSFS